jgi:hypothetical protein
MCHVAAVLKLAHTDRTLSDDSGAMGRWKRWWQRVA